MPNPLRKLSDQLGLQTDLLAKHLGLSENMVIRALRIEPLEPLATYLVLMEHLGVKMRIRASDDPLRLWVSVPAIDGLHQNNAWRKSVGYCTLPPDRGQLVAYVRFLRNRHNWTYGDIKIHLERNYIPTAEGLANWRGSTIGAICNGGKVADADRELGYSDAFATSFRATVAKQLLVRLFAFDPFAPVRYEVDGYEDGRVLILEAHQPTPEFVSSWAYAAIRKLRWFDESQWGIGVPVGQAEEAEEEAGEGTRDGSDVRPVP